MALSLSGDGKELYLSLTKEVRAEIDKTMVALAKQVDNTIDNLANEVENYIGSRPTLPKKRIVDQLDELRIAGGGMFDTANRELIKRVTDKTFEISEDVFFSELEQAGEYDRSNDTLMWQAMFVRTCPDCMGLHGQIRTRKTWNIIGGPNERATLCTIRGVCHCVLVLADTMPSKAEMREPIKIQQERIRKAEKKRGKKYARSTRLAYLGRINDPTNKVYDLRKVKRLKNL